MNVIHFSKNIKHLRKRRGETQGDLSDVLLIDKTSYGAYERGITYPKFELLLKLSEHFQVNLHDLVFTDLEQHPNGAPSETPDPQLERTVLRLNREIDRLSAEVIARADPEDLEGLKAYRADLIKRFPEQARALGIRE